MLRRNRMALKEWATVVWALGEGLQTVLLRKGGVAEEGGGFRLAAGEFFFYPTFEHQQADLLQPQYAERFRRLAVQNRSPAGVLLEHYGVATDVVPAPPLGRMKQLRDLFVWNEAFLDQRYGYRPELPLRLLLVRTYRLRGPLAAADRPSYAGCHSWVELEESFETEGVIPVFSDEEFQAQRNLWWRQLR